MMPLGPYTGPAPVVPETVTGPAYVAAYRRGWEARNAAPVGACPWAPTTSQPRATYRRLWLRGFNDCGRARMARLRETSRVTV